MPAPRRTALALLAAVFCCAGCAAAPNTLTIAVGLLPSELPVYRQVVNDFEAASGWRVVIVPQQYADIRRALAAEAGTPRGTLDLVELDVYSLAPAARFVEPPPPGAIDSVVDALLPAAVRAGTVDGLRFVPHRLSWQAMLYDHAVLGAPPVTWAELLEVARTHPGRIGFKAALYEGLTCDVLPFVWAGGGSGEVLDDAGARAAFDLFAALAPYVSPHSASFKEATIAEAMSRGEIVLHLNWPFAMALYAAQGLAPARIRAAPLPVGPAGRATVLGGGYLGIPRGAAHPDASLALIRHLLARDTQERLARQLGWFSPRRDVAPADAAGLLAGYTAMRDQVRSRPERPDYPQLSRAWQQAFRRVVLGGEAPDPTLHELAATLPTAAGAAP